MKQTVLHPAHQALSAKMTDFQGWQVPLLFSDLQDEYHAVRSAAGLFDIGFLGRVEVRGPGAETLLQGLIAGNVAKIPEGSAHYGLLCNASGFILDDPVLFHLPSTKTAGSRYLLTLNAVNTGKILDRLRQHGNEDVQIEDRSDATAHLALQGPKSVHILERLAGPGFKKMKPRSVRNLTVAGVAALVSRIGYAGEQGYEFIVSSADAAALWDALVKEGWDAGIRPCGFAARDILRLEKGHVLYGNDIDETRTPIEAGLSAFVDFKKNSAATETLQRLKDKGTAQRLAGFMLLDKGVPKNGGSIFSENREIGVVTSGSQSPLMRAGIGLGYVVSRYAQPGQEIEIEVRDREIAARIMEMPFYRKKQ
jgi:aminomethyltransferase